MLLLIMLVIWINSRINDNKNGELQKIVAKQQTTKYWKVYEREKKKTQPIL
jgi:hypothetical protein